MLEAGLQNNQSRQELMVTIKRVTFYHMITTFLTSQPTTVRRFVAYFRPPTLGQSNERRAHNLASRRFLSIIRLSRKCFLVTRRLCGDSVYHSRPGFCFNHRLYFIYPPSRSWHSLHGSPTRVPPVAQTTREDEWTNDAISILAKALIPTQSSWYPSYVDICRRAARRMKRRVFVPANGLFRDITQGRIELRSPVDDLSLLMGGAFEADDWSIRLQFSIKDRLSAALWLVEMELAPGITTVRLSSHSVRS